MHPNKYLGSEQTWAMWCVLVEMDRLLFEGYLLAGADQLTESEHQRQHCVLLEKQVCDQLQQWTEAHKLSQDNQPGMCPKYNQKLKHSETEDTKGKAVETCLMELLCILKLKDTEILTCKHTSEAYLVPVATIPLGLLEWDKQTRYKGTCFLLGGKGSAAENVFYILHLITMLNSQSEHSDEARA